MKIFCTPFLGKRFSQGGSMDETFDFRRKRIVIAKMTTFFGYKSIFKPTYSQNRKRRYTAWKPIFGGFSAK
jgi:hypothetical protein